MRWVFFIWLAFGCPVAGIAAPVVVKSGEHSGFTRVVLHLSSNMAWETRETGTGVVVEFPDQSPDFDLASAFLRIGKDRVAGFEALPKALQINYACQCAASVHAIGAQMIVVDVAPSAKPVETKSETTILPNPAIVLARSKSEPVSPAISSALNQTGLKDQIVNPELAKKRLLKQLGRAASMGLVDLTIPDSQVENMDASANPARIAGVISHHAGIDASPVLLDEIKGELANQGVSDEGEDCLSDSLFDTASWIHGTDFTSGLRKLRQELGGEITEIDHSTALQLVHHYLAFGFGAEALMLLPHAGEGPDIQWLQSIANIIDEDNDSADRGFSRFSNCNSAVAMWALLDHPAEERVGNLDTAPILRAFSDLTVPLQDVLAPRLGNALLAHGEQKAAQTVLRIVQRRTTLAPAEMEHLGAKLETHLGEEEIAKKKLIKTIQADAPISPIALAELIEDEIRLGRTISPETVDLLASYYQQHRRDAIAPRLLKVLILANALAGQFEQSWALMANSDKDIRDALTIRSGFATALADHGTDLDFMRYGTILVHQPSRMAAKANRSMAERMLALGFPDLAKSFLSDPANGTDEHDRKILLARIALETGEMFGAKAHLLGLVGPDVDRMLGLIEQADTQTTPVRQVAANPLRSSVPSLEQSHASLNASKALRGQLDETLAELTVLHSGTE